MAKHHHEIRDPLHNFVRVTADEVAAINSRPFQRLRNIHQLALTYLVYPGATHRRFEHSLGVMELAGRVFDVITHEQNRHPDLDLFPDSETLVAWRKVVRLAALFHDLGHLPFSHAAEEELLPDGKHHEWLTVEVLRSAEMRDVLKGMMPSPDPDLVGQDRHRSGEVGQMVRQRDRFQRVGSAHDRDRDRRCLRRRPDRLPASRFAPCRRRLWPVRSLPADRHASHTPSSHAGTADDRDREGRHPCGRSARQFMFLQLYYHHVRLAYDIHLSEFMVQWLQTYPTDVEGHLCMTDNEVLSAIAASALDKDRPGHDQARRIAGRGHFRKIYERNALDQRVDPNAVGRVAAALRKQFGGDAVREKTIPPKPQNIEFPVLLDGGEISTSRAESTIYAELKPAAIGVVLIDPEKKRAAKKWLTDNKRKILSDQMELGV